MSFSNGKRDAELNKPTKPQGVMGSLEYQNYLSGHKAGRKK